MKKQIFAIAFIALIVPTILFAPAFQGSTPQPQRKKVNGGDGEDKGSTTITTAAGLVAAFPNSAPDLVAGAIAGSGVSSDGNASSAAGKAAQTFVQTGTVTVPSANNKQSARLGRLSK